MGCLMVIFVQCSVIALVINLWVQDPTSSFKQANEFSIFVPRFLSSIMMHLMCEPGIQNGISLMKYTVNHPHNFRNAKNQNGSTSLSGILPPFFIGFSQALTTIMVELIVVIYLCTQTNVMSIIMQFMALSSISKFDDFYAINLRNNKINGAIGKLL